jgi:GNAT superfamily N-acetyltransferase
LTGLRNADDRRSSSDRRRCGRDLDTPRRARLSRRAHDRSAELDAQPGTAAFVTTKNGRVIGAVVTNTRRHLHRAASVTSIDALVVDAAHRSAGIGGALLDAVMDHARAAGSVHLDLHSNTRRAGARRFYERAGFIVTSNHFVREL